MMKFQPYNKQTASLEDRIAWALCQIIDDDAPLGWTRYRFAARCIARSENLMADLKQLAARETEPAPEGDASPDRRPLEDGFYCLDCGVKQPCDETLRCICCGVALQ